MSNDNDGLDFNEDDAAMVKRWEEQDRERAAGKAAKPERNAGEKAERGDVLLDELDTFLSRFVIYPSEHARIAHVLWIVHTHLMDRWESTPRLAFLSPEPASGKTRALEITELLVPSPVSAVNVSPAYLFRKVSGGNVTILFDEIDTVFGPKAKENEEIRGLLNAGHRRGAVAGRCVVHGSMVKTEEIPAYAAVALAGLGWLPDTILSRSIIVRMRRRRAGERVEQYRRRIHVVSGDKLRSKIEVWARTVPGVIDWEAMSLPPEVQDRDADVWEPLIAVADLAGGAWPELARVTAVTLVTLAGDREPSLGIRLLEDVRTVFGSAEEMPTESLLRGLHLLKESPWTDLKGKPLNDRGLAHRLRQYEVKPTVLGGGAQRGYRREDLHDAWEIYLPCEYNPNGSVGIYSQDRESAPTFLSLSDRSVTSVTSVTNGGIAGVAAVAAVTDVTHVTLVAGDERVVVGRGARVTLRIVPRSPAVPRQNGHRCAQCAGEPDGQEHLHMVQGSPTWLHRECARFFKPPPEAA
jgi:hypothetical protein